MGSIYPKSFEIVRVMKFLNLNKPLRKPEIKVDLIKCSECEQEIDYSQIDKMKCVQVGIHIK